MNRRTYFTAVADRLHADELAYVQRMYWLVKEAHRKQMRRLTGERFFEHVRRVSYMLGVTYGYCDAQSLSLGLGHDLIEDTYVPQTVIVNLFGQGMYDQLLAMSKEIPSFHPVTGRLIARAKIPMADYQAGLIVAGARVINAKGCDRLDNLADLEQWEPERRKKYILETRNDIMPVVKLGDARIGNDVFHRLLQVEHNITPCDICGKPGRDCDGHIGEGFQ